jgi:alpha-ketoglutarate-dependent taurine dioxygenase
MRSLRTSGFGANAAARKLVNVSPGSMVQAAPLFSDRRLPLLVTPADSSINLAAWAARNQSLIQAALAQHGGILFRNFQGSTVDQFEQFISEVSGETLQYNERSSPRTRVGDGNIYTSTDYPAAQSIFVHNENSYRRNFNLKIFFFCETPALEGGETPLADCRNVYQRLSLQTRARFEEKDWMYVRNYGDGFGLDWQTVFQTTDKRAVEDYCRRNKIEVEWRADNKLRTRAVLPATIKHPVTGETVWFNHATFFNVSTLDPLLREGLLASGNNDRDLPTNTYYGDGSPIEPETLEELRAAYWAETVSFPWRRGDVLMLDNILVAHGRAPYKGPRKILVGMSELANR